MQSMLEAIMMPQPAMRARHNPAIRAETLFFETAAGGAGAIPIYRSTGDVARNAYVRRRVLGSGPWRPPDPR